MTISWVSGLMTLPAAAYLSANAIEWASGTQGTSGVFGDTFAHWSSLGLTLLVVGGPALAVVLITIASLRVRAADRGEDGVRVTIDVRMSRGQLRLAALSLSLLGGTIAYWFNQSWPCLYENQWVC